MPIVHRDRTLETCTGTGPFALTGATTGYQPFASGDDGKQFYLVIQDTSALWMTFLGTYTDSGRTISVDTVLSSSAGGTTPPSWVPGTKLIRNSPVAKMFDVPQLALPVTVPYTVNSKSLQAANLVCWLPPRWANPTNGSANSWDMSAVGTNTFSTSSGTWSYDSTYGYVMSLNGSSQFLAPSPRSTSMSVTECTLFVRFKATLGSPQICLFSALDGSITVYLYPDGHLFARFTDSSGTDINITSAAGVISSGTWYGLALTYGPGTYKVTVNGTVVASGTYTLPMISSTSPLIISPAALFPFAGSVCDFRMYSTASDALVADIFANPTGLYLISQ